MHRVNLLLALGVLACVIALWVFDPPVDRHARDHDLPKVTYHGFITARP